MFSPYTPGAAFGTFELTTMVRSLLTGPYWSGLAKIMAATWGHGNYSDASCTMDAIVTYLTDDTASAEITSCPAVEPSLDYQYSILAD